MLRSSKKVVVISMGDPQGIGPEVVRKALSHKSLLAKGRFIVVGDKKILGHVHSSVGVVDVSYRSPGEGSLKFLDKAILLIKGGVADALVTAPLSKEAVSKFHNNFGPQAGHSVGLTDTRSCSQLFVGHTEYLAQAFQVKNFDMMFIAGNLRLTIVTRHVPLKDVPKMITQKAVLDSITLMAVTLKEKFRIKAPKIAVLGLNPHAGEGGLLGYEDLKSILPAVRKARLQGINAIGPLPADTFFAFNRSYDGIIAMYHDQGLAPIKGMFMKELVNFTAGLPFVRTSPAHGTAYDIVGKNKADPSSMLASIKLACELA